MSFPAATIEVASPPRFSARQRVILFVLLGAGFMLSVDFSILNVALPLVGAGVGLGPTGLPWISSAFALPAAGFTLMFGRLGDLFGRRRLFLSGLVVLAGASLLGGFASSSEMLLTARVLQGFATAMTIPAAMSLLTTTFAEGPARDRVLGLNGALLSGGFTVGALVGGTLINLLGWRAAFFINIPVAVVVLLVTPHLIAESKRPVRVRLDLPGAMTVTGGLLAVIYAVIEKSVASAVVGTVVIRWMICRASPSLRSVSCQCSCNRSRCRSACAAMILLSFFISRRTALRARLASFFRRACVIFMHNWFIRLRNSSGSSIRTFKFRLRIRIVAFIRVRAASRNSTQSTGK